MSNSITLSNTPVQITDGTSKAHVTVESGFMAYADSVDSVAWHTGAKSITIEAGYTIFMKLASGTKATITVTTIS